MADQTHIIKKQIVEVYIDEDDAPELQGRLGQVIRRELTPLIDACCDALSRPDEIHRIDRLELDIGHIDPDLPEGDLVEKVKEQLFKELEEKIKNAPSLTKQPDEKAQKEGTPIELLHVFMETGLLPWWADVKDLYIIKSSVDETLKNSPGQLKGLFLDALHHETFFKRLIYTFSYEDLVNTIQLFLSGRHLWVSDLEKILREACKTAKKYRTLSMQKKKLERWKALFWVIAHPKNAGKQDKELIREVIWQASERLQPSYLQLMKEVAKKSEKLLRGSSSSYLKEITHELYKEYKTDKRHTEKLTDRYLSPALLQLLDQHILHFKMLLQKTNLFRDYASAFIRDLNLLAPDDLPGETKNQLLKLVQMLLSKELTDAIVRDVKKIGNELTLVENMPVARKNTRDKFKFLYNERINIHEESLELLAHLRALLKEKMSLMLKEKIGSITDSLIKTNSPENMIRQRALLEKVEEQLKAFKLVPKVRDSDKKRSDALFNESEEIYVNNAGLVLLWLFLGNFFKKIGLTDDNSFVDEAAAVRASLILQYLVNSEVETMEYHLPLNKVLCGIPIEKALEIDLSIKKKEIAECENMLGSVIKLWPKLNDISLAGFRSAYLQREGVLSYRDSSWTLNVERKAYDIIVDRIPWSITVVKLPWMDAMMYVEW